MRIPFISLSAGGLDLIPVWGPLMISLVVSDEKGIESDKITVELDDAEGQCAYPGVGQVVTVSGGYEGEGGRVTGQFEIDQVDFDGYPQKITLHGTTVSAKKETKERKTEAHKKEDTKTLGDLAKKIGKRNGWTPKISPEVAKIELEYEGQAGEYDAQFLTRVAKRFGAIVTVKQGNLVVSKAGAGKSVSGAELSPIFVTGGVNVLGYRCSIKKRPDHGKVEAHTFDRKKVETDVAKKGDGESTFRIRMPFKNKKEAEAAADAMLAELGRATGSVTFEIEGETSAKAEAPVIASGIRGKVDGKWNSTKVEHRWDGDGYQTTVECEAPESKTEKEGDE